MEGLLDVRGLTLSVPMGAGARARLVDGISFAIGKGEIVALVGESGCGKSLSALALLDLVPEPVRVDAGEILFEGRDVRRLPERDKRRVRGGGIGFVFQEPGAALDPVRSMGEELVAVLRRHRGLNRQDAESEAVAWLARVALPEPEKRFRDLPHQMSGGMKQRAMLALALAGGPRLLVADEPTTALDVTVQAQILALLHDLREGLGLSVLLITHDLGVVAETADRTLVMYAGEIVEEASVSGLFDAPRHPYTRALLASRPTVRDLPGQRLRAISGNVPEPGNRPPGCAFAPRCPSVFERCRGERPRLEGEPLRRAACFLAGDSGEGRAA
ncbi:MAG: ABC transporter ATP-binding protein [Acidobacteria bacterium]|nr:ABC transporter ATP-binding protein [Acidobacteriota bacterium]